MLIGMDLDFGNFSCMSKANLKKIVNINNLQNHYSASILRSKIPFSKIDCEKGFIIEGGSKLNFWKHFAHALMSLSVFVDLIAIKFFFISLGGIVLSIILVHLAFARLRLFINSRFNNERVLLNLKTFFEYLILITVGYLIFF